VHLLLPVLALAISAFVAQSKLCTYQLCEGTGIEIYREGSTRKWTIKVFIKLVHYTPGQVITFFSMACS
jgi:hypothetical protein